RRIWKNVRRTCARKSCRSRALSARRRGWRPGLEFGGPNPSQCGWSQDSSGYDVARARASGTRSRGEMKFCSRGGHPERTERPLMLSEIHSSLSEVEVLEKSLAPTRLGIKGDVL